MADADLVPQKPLRTCVSFCVKGRNHDLRFVRILVDFALVQSLLLLSRTCVPGGGPHDDSNPMSSILFL
jgi:hypothetical protein